MDTQPQLSEPASSPAPLAPIKPRSVTPRAILLALFLMPINAYWVVMMENFRYSAHPTTISLFFNCIFILVVLTGINGLVVRIRPRWAFSQGELVLVYSMLCIGSCMAAHDFAQLLVPNLSWPFYQSNSSNGYLPLFERFLPVWAMVSDKDATKGFYQGHQSLYTPEHLHAWLPAVLIWTGFVIVLLWTMQCVNVLIRKQWTDNERLIYPLTKIPLEITDAQPFGRGRSEQPLTKSRLFWGGFAVAATIDLMNSLNYYYPQIPALGFGNGASQLDLGLNVHDKPWNAIGWTPLTFFPFCDRAGHLDAQRFSVFVLVFFIFSGSCKQ